MQNLNSGHYTSIAQRPGWTMFNDDKTRLMNHPGSASDTAYLLLYSAVVGRRLAPKT